MVTKAQQAYLDSLEEQYDPAKRLGRRSRRLSILGAGGGLSVAVTLAGGQGNPTKNSPINFTVTFSKPVSGFTNADVSFAGSTIGGTLAATVTGTGPAYNIAVSGMTAGTGTVVVSIPAGGVTDSSGLPNPVSNTASVVYDTVAPSVTVNQAAGQADPTSSAPINFTAQFSENVLPFTTVSFTGSTAGGTLAATVTGSGATYNIAVTGMTTAGNVVVSLAAAVTTDLAGNASLASTSTDNTVAWTVAVGGLLDFSDPNNSMYLPTFGLGA
jgi:hypothetical protein